jgi:medium-chain acyl-[acyl-carrier-protein] hydrolase
MLRYENEFTLLESDFDSYDNMKLSSYLDLFQTVAGDHAKEMGIGFNETLKKGLAWVITKVKLTAIKKLVSAQKIKVVTLPLQKGALDYIRDYYIYDENGETVAIGSSQWVLIDYNSRRISRAVIEYDGECTKKSAYENTKIEKVPEFDGELKYTHTAIPLDIDHNGHVNNIRYADMTLCASYGEKRPIKSAVLNFSSECKLGDKIDIFVKTEGDATFYFGKNGEKTSFTAKIEY